MSAPTMAADWRRANAEALRDSLRQLRAQLQHHAALVGAGSGAPRPLDWLVAADGAARARPAPPPVEARAGDAPALSALVQLAGLSEFETHLVLLAAAPSLDGAFARAYTELHDDPRRDHATLQLALSLFTRDATERLLEADCLMPTRRLRALRLVDLDDDEREPVLTRRLGVDERLSDYLRGANHLDARVARIVAPVRELPLSAGAVAAADEIAAIIGSDAGRWSTVNVIGGAAAGAREAARLACASLGLRPQMLDLRRFSAGDPSERASLIALLGREAMLLGLALIVDASEAAPGTAASLAVDELIASLMGTLCVLGPERWPGAITMPEVRIARPTRVEQRVLWHEALDPHAHSVNGEVESITQQFDFGVGEIADVVSRVARRGGEITGRALWAACREQTGASLEELARRIAPSYGWDDIVVNDDVRAQLRELAAQVAQRARVYESWGFGAQLGRGRGITALFAGATGTGKTMAAEILAAHLELDLFRIDLAGVVSKYVGETEKNLRRVFDAAERSGAILFFDEADALFGARTEVRDSHDRYANLEINYLLQRMEDYAGLAILATNRRSALDAAFLRRLRFVIDFPFPGADDRRRIWSQVFPREAQVDGLELSTLSALDVSGGNIRSIAINAAFLAASEGATIGMPHLMRAAVREYVKLGKPVSAAEFGAYTAVARR